MIRSLKSCLHVFCVCVISILQWSMFLCVSSVFCGGVCFSAISFSLTLSWRFSAVLPHHRQCAWLCSRGGDAAVRGVSFSPLFFVLFVYFVQRMSVDGCAGDIFCAECSTLPLSSVCVSLRVCCTVGCSALSVHHTCLLLFLSFSLALISMQALFSPPLCLFFWCLFFFCLFFFCLCVSLLCSSCVHAQRLCCVCVCACASSAESALCWVALHLRDKRISLCIQHKHQQ